MSTLKMRAPLPVQVACDKIALNATLHATLASPASKSGEYTGGRLNLGSLSGKHSLTGTFMGDSFMSKMSSHEADFRYLEMQADETISVPIAKLREDTEVLNAVVELQSRLRRLIKRTLYCELFPWCSAAPMHPADRMHLPVLLPSAGNCHTGVYTYPQADFHVDFEETPYMWRCVPGKTLRICRRCGQFAKCGLPNVWGYSIKAAPKGYACRDAVTRRQLTGKTIVSMSTTGYRPESMPTGFRLEKGDEFVKSRPMGGTYSYVPKGTIVLAPDGRQDPAQLLQHVDPVSMRIRSYLDETRDDGLFPDYREKSLVKAKLWPRLAAAKIQRATRAHQGRVMLRALAKAKWDRLNRWAAMTIQSSWLMHVARAQTRRKEAMLVLRKWISEHPTKHLQRVVRGHFGRVAFRAELERTRQWRNIPKIQAAVRRCQQRVLYTEWWIEKDNPLTWQIPDPTRMRLREQAIPAFHAECPHPALERSKNAEYSKRGHLGTCSSSLGSFSDNYLLIAGLNSPVVGKFAFASPVRSFDTDKSGALTAVGQPYLSFPSGSSPLRKQRFFGDFGAPTSPIRPKALISPRCTKSPDQSIAGDSSRHTSSHSNHLHLDTSFVTKSMLSSPRCLTPLSERSFPGSHIGSKTSKTVSRSERGSRDQLSPITLTESAVPAHSPHNISCVTQRDTEKSRRDTEKRLKGSVSFDLTFTVNGDFHGIRNNKDTFVKSSSRRQHAATLQEMFDAERRRSETASYLAHKLQRGNKGGDDEGSESGVSTGGSSVQSMLELKMWRRASMSRIEFNQGQKQKVSKMFRNVSPTTTQKHRRSRAKEADYDILGGQPWPTGGAASSCAQKVPRVVPSHKWRTVA